MTDCNHNCSECGENCESREEDFDFKAYLNPVSSVKKVYGIVSGKGGVGKSLVTSLLAVTACAMNYKTAILDADITGPSIPKAFGMKGHTYMSEDGIMPVTSKLGIDVMSLNLLLDNDTDPVAWRGPIIAGTVKQFWTDVVWDDEDVMFIDMPPGTGDVTLTVFQSLPIDGIIIVTSPQELVGMIVEKAVKMAELMKVPVVGLVENMSYIECPDCGAKLRPFGESRLEEFAAKYGIQHTAALPIDAKIAAAVDNGKIEDLAGVYFKDLVGILMK